VKEKMKREQNKKRTRACRACNGPYNKLWLGDGKISYKSLLLNRDPFLSPVEETHILPDRRSFSFKPVLCISSTVPANESAIAFAVNIFI